ncbi:MAG: hypothetical protein ACMXYM_01600 [Candidatus Woesearchaeota archaeon]
MLVGGLFFSRSGPLQNLFGVPIILEVLVSLAMWLLSILATVYLIGSRSPKS